MHALTGDDRWRRRAENALRAYAVLLAEQPAALGEMLLAVDCYTDRPPEIVLVWPTNETQARKRSSTDYGDTFIPNFALLGASEGAALEALARVTPLAADKTTISGAATAYVCERGTCGLPTTEPAVMSQQLAERTQRVY